MIEGRVGSAPNTEIYAGSVQNVEISWSCQSYPRIHRNSGAPVTSLMNCCSSQWSCWRLHCSKRINNESILSKFFNFVLPHKIFCLSYIPRKVADWRGVHYTTLILVHSVVCVFWNSGFTFLSQFFDSAFFSSDVCRSEPHIAVAMTSYFHWMLLANKYIL